MYSYSVVLRNGHFSQADRVAARSEHANEAAAHRDCRVAGNRFRVVYGEGPWRGLDLQSLQTVVDEIDEPTAAQMRRYIMGPCY